MITPDSLMGLVDSIREHGVLEPLVVAHTPAGYQIIAGERRWRAAKLAGVTTLPVIIREATPKQMLQMAIVENVQREDLNPLERAKAFRRLQDDFGMGTAEIAEQIGKSQAYVSNSLRLLTLPDLLKDGLISGQTTEGHVRALAALEDPRLVAEAYKKVLSENLSVRGAEELARRIKNREGLTGKGIQPSGRRRVNQTQTKSIQEHIYRSVRSQAEKMGEEVKVKVVVFQSKVRGEIRIRLNGRPEQTTPLLEKLQEFFQET
jgi:ParB family chromosome partitioning protein